MPQCLTNFVDNGVSYQADISYDPPHSVSHGFGRPTLDPSLLVTSPRAGLSPGLIPLCVCRSPGEAGFRAWWLGRRMVRGIKNVFADTPLPASLPGGWKSSLHLPRSLVPTQNLAFPQW